ncbi:MAG: glutaminyl-peptide cyclotransferase [Mucilaginibacter sp.]
MKLKYNALITAAILLAFVFNSCKENNTKQEVITVSPEAGTTYKSGDKVDIAVHYGSLKPDSIVYFIDSVRAGAKKDSSAFSVKTDGMSLGPKTIDIKVYAEGKNQDVATNIVLLPAKAPEELSFKIEKVFPHDTSCFTEGLVYEKGYLYESGGGYLDPPPNEEVTGQSSLRKVELSTGKVLQKTMVDPKVFAEGISIVGDKIIQLTYHEKIGYVYDKSSLKLLSNFENKVGIEGWGMCFDGNRLCFDDKTNRIYFLDKNTYKETGHIDVYDEKGAVNEINELEYIDGKIYANIWQTTTIIAIDPKTGAVLQRIDCTNLYPKNKRNENSEVMNGIAYDPAGKRIFLTGKKWDKLFQVSFVKK